MSGVHFTYFNTKDKLTIIGAFKMRLLLATKLSDIKSFVVSHAFKDGKNCHVIYESLGSQGFYDYLCEALDFPELQKAINKEYERHPLDDLITNF